MAERLVRLTGLDFQIEDLGARPKMARGTCALPRGDAARCELDIHGHVSITQITEITHFTLKKI
jgi:hypothetical protein